MRTSEAEIESARQRARNKATVRITQIQNGFNVVLGDNPVPFFCKDLDADTGESVVDKVIEFYEELGARQGKVS